MRHSGIFAVALAGAAAVAAAQGTSTQNGVYSEAQATRGEAVYKASCAGCHGPDLEGSGQAPSLDDADFAKDWEGQPLSDLFERINTTMPADAPGTLKASDVADVLAFVLKKGNHPAGATELPADPATLKTVTFNAKARAPR
jgi:mono/diheme cytochrome c family protein